MLCINYWSILVELGHGIGNLHPILDDLGCIPPHIKYMNLLQSTDTIYILRNQIYTCYLQYSGAQF